MHRARMLHRVAGLCKTGPPAAGRKGALELPILLAVGVKSV
jgi:hypothetical protein